MAGALANIRTERSGVGRRWIKVRDGLLKPRDNLGRGLFRQVAIQFIAKSDVNARVP